MIKTKCKMKQKHDTKPGKVKHITMEEYYKTAPEGFLMRQVEQFTAAAEAAKVDSMEMDLDELDAYILANAK